MAVLNSDASNLAKRISDEVQQILLLTLNQFSVSQSFVTPTNRKNDVEHIEKVNCICSPWTKAFRQSTPTCILPILPAAVYIFWKEHWGKCKRTKAATVFLYLSLSKTV